MSHALLRVQRMWSVVPMYWNVGALAVKVDGAKITKIDEGKTASLPISPGHHVITVATTFVVRNIESDPIEISVQPDEQVQMYCRFDRNGRASIVRLWREGDQVAGQEMARDKHIEVPLAHNTSQSVGNRAADEPGAAEDEKAPSSETILGAVGMGGSSTAGPFSVQLRETHESEEAVGIEIRNIENPSARSTVTRTIRITREWTRSYAMDIDRVGRSGGEFAVGISLAGIKAKAESELRAAYNLAATKREEFTDEVVLHVEPASRVRLQLEWKKVWQHGVIDVRCSTGDIVQIPYRVVISLTFDQRTVDIEPPDDALSTT